MTEDIGQILERYVVIFPDERGRLQRLFEQIERQGISQLMSRQNFDAGHVTASGVVIDPNGEQVLLIEHPSLKKLIQPGGHVEPDDADPLAAAYREIEEEVGFAPDALRYVPLDPVHRLTPIDIDIHRIPAQPSRQEPTHYHYDFRYLFVPKPGAVPRSAEGSAPRWAAWTDLAKSDLAHLPAKIKKLLP